MKTCRILLIVASVFTSAAFAQAQTRTDPPSSQHAILTSTGKGVQIYIYQQSDNGPQWVFQAPEAILTGASGKAVATHGAGPTWRSQDGSSVKGEIVAKSPSPDPTAIPWLLLKTVATTGSGIMTRVSYIRRSDTHGGNPRTIGCDAQHRNDVSCVPYTATYTFYAAKPYRESERVNALQSESQMGIL